MSDRRANSKSKHRRPSAAARKGQRAVVLTVTGGMAAGGFIAGAGSAVADHTIVSQAEGYFLGGNVGGLSLGDLLPTAKAVNKSHDTSSSVVDSELGLNLGTFGLPNVALPGLDGVGLFGSSGILDASLLNEYARANGDGSSYGGSGAVTKTGAIESGAPRQNVELDLEPLVGGVLSTVADIDLSIGALAGTAKQTKGGAQTGDYKIADLVIDLKSPALATILGTLSTAITTVDSTLEADLLSAVTAIVPGAELTGTLPDLSDPLATFNNTLMNDSDGISVNPDGSIKINVSKIANLNDLPPNTDILPLILDALDGVLLGALGTLRDDLKAELDDATAGASLLGVPLNNALVTAAIDTVLDAAETSVLDALTEAKPDQAALLDQGSGGLIGDILDDTLNLIANVQVKAGGKFTERALSVGLSLPVLNNAMTASAVAQGSVALIHLANASVGPNAGPVAAALAPPVITEPDNGDETTDRTPIIEGTGVPGATVTVREGDRVLCTTKVKSNGTWRCTSATLALGKHTIVATQKLGDRTSARSNRVTFAVVAKDSPQPPPGPGLPATGGNGSTAPLAAAALGLMLGGIGLTAAPRLVRHGGASSGGSGAHARGGRHARR